MEQYPPSPHSCCKYLPQPRISYSCGFRFDAEVMDGFFTCVERMVVSEQEREEISKEMEIYRMAGGTFGFSMAIKSRMTKMPGKLYCSVCFKFQLSNLIIHCLFIIFASHFYFNL